MYLPELPIDGLRALARRNFPFFARGAFHALHPSTDIHWNWHLDFMASHLADVFEGRCQRLILNVPPRYGKSLMGSISLPAFILGHNPLAQIMCMTYAQDLSEHMADLTRRLMCTRYYHEVFGPRLTSNRVRLRELKTIAGGSRLATSVDGTVTGRGGDFLIVDDPLKPGDAHSEARRSAVNSWFDSTVFSRTNNKAKGATIIIMQRLHEDDLVGHLIERGDWRVVSLRAIAEEDETHHYNTVFGPRTYVRKEGEALHPSRQSVEALMIERQNMGVYEYTSQYQQRPVPIGGEIVHWDWFRTFDPASPPEFTRIVQSWDTANTEKKSSDFSVGITFGETRDLNWYILDVYRGRLNFPDLKRKVHELAGLHRASTVLIENHASGIQLAQQLREEGFHKVEAIDPKGSKYERMMACSARIEAGKVWLPSQAHWLDALQHELTFFPRGKNDDQVDALSQGLLWISEMSGPAHWLRMMDEADRRRSQGI